MSSVAQRKPGQSRLVHGSALQGQLQNAGLYLIYAAVALVFLFPLLWVASLSLKDLSTLFAYPPRLIPQDPAFGNYVEVFKQSQLGVFLVNSAKIVVFTVLGTLLVAIPAAFAFSRTHFRSKNLFLFGILIFQMMSPLVIAIPLYRYFNVIGILNQHWSTILVYIAVELPFQTWLLRGFFTSIPRSLDEAAIIDGCTPLQAMIHVILPVSTPGIASVIVYAGIRSWSQFIIPFVLLSDNENFPVSVGILNYQSTVEVISTHFLAAASVLSVLPAVLLFVVFQRFIISAITAGAVKG
jgi:multiple sugar transport system permease protein